MSYRQLRSIGLGLFAYSLISFVSSLSPACAEEGQAIFEQGVTAMTMQNWQRAAQLFSDAIERNPNHVQAYFKRGQCQSRLGNYVQAVQDFSKAIELKPDDSNAYLERGTGYARLDRHKEAVQDYLLAIRLKPELARQYQNGLIQSGGQNKALEKNVAKDHIGAVRDYEDAMGLFIAEESTGSKQQVNMTYSNSTPPQHGAELEEIISPSKATSTVPKPEQEIKNINKAMQMDPTNPELYFKRGRLSQQLKRFDSARNDFSKAISMDPMQAKYYLARARLYHEQNQPDLCAADIKQAQSVDARIPLNLRFAD